MDAYITRAIYIYAEKGAGMRCGTVAKVCMAESVRGYVCKIIKKRPKVVPLAVRYFALEGTALLYNTVA